MRPAAWLVSLALLAGCAASPTPRAPVEPAQAVAVEATTVDVDDDHHVHVVSAERDIDCPRCGGWEPDAWHAADLTEFARWWTRRTWRNVLVEGRPREMVWLGVETPPRRTAADR